MRYVGKRAGGTSAALRGWFVAGGAQVFDVHQSGFIWEAAACRVGIPLAEGRREARDIPQCTSSNSLDPSLPGDPGSSVGA